MQNSPYQIKLSNDKKYYWCTCGLSANQPFCDGAHKGTGKKSLCFELNDANDTSRAGSGNDTSNEFSEVWLCGCKLTKNPPYCDGSHTLIEN
jgi:CDGSH-type Zn-finger protein